MKYLVHNIKNTWYALLNARHLALRLDEYIKQNKSNEERIEELERMVEELTLRQKEMIEEMETHPDFRELSETVEKLESSVSELEDQDEVAECLAEALRQVADDIVPRRY